MTVCVFDRVREPETRHFVNIVTRNHACCCIYLRTLVDLVYRLDLETDSIPPRMGAKSYADASRTNSSLSQLCNRPLVSSCSRNFGCSSPTRKLEMAKNAPGKCFRDGITLMDPVDMFATGKKRKHGISTRSGMAICIADIAKT